jgi:hypothetical protein
MTTVTAQPVSASPDTRQNPLLKGFALLAWFAVGALFIFSGLIKLNDPMGTAIKLEEYFEVFATDFGSFFHNFMPLATFLAVAMSAAEVALGVALLVRWKVKEVLWALLAMIVFFTFLTFYSAYFNKVTDCGCFGDAIKLTPWQSFSKDIILLVLIVALLGLRNYLPRPSRYGGVITAIATVLSVAMGWWALRHLPFKDFRAYKVGNNLPAMMKPSAPLRYKYIMTRNGETKEFEQYPTDTTWKYKEMVLLNPEDQQKITDYSVWNDQGDFTQQTFQGTKLLLIIQKLEKTNEEAYPEINKLLSDLSKQSKQVEPIIITAADAAAFDKFRHEHNLAVPFYFADATVLKTMIRSNPGLMLLQEGTVLGQWSSHDIPTAAEITGKLGK